MIIHKRHAFSSLITRFYCKGPPIVRRAVLVSTSQDIYTNLALEDWFYKNHDFKDNHLLMLWINEPCVVIGRHQNPWLECNVKELKGANVALARRNSGGGTVFHDGGNLNLTFFTPKEHYNRRNNLELITNAILHEFGLKVDISKRQDLTIADHKISGTAAKLARLVAYHHCTLLVNANKDLLRKTLLKPDYEIITNATKSIPSKICNLSQENAKINVDNLLKAIGTHYLLHNNVSVLEKTPNLLNTIKLSNERFTRNCSKTGGAQIDFNSKKFHLVEPNETNFPGLEEIRAGLQDWLWIYGKSPKFVVRKIFKMTKKHKANQIIFTESANFVFMLNIEVEKGRIIDVNVTTPRNYAGANLNKRLVGINDFKNMEFNDEVVHHLMDVFKEEEFNLDEAKNSVNILS